VLNDELSAQTSVGRGSAVLFSDVEERLPVGPLVGIIPPAFKERQLSNKSISSPEPACEIWVNDVQVGNGNGRLAETANTRRYASRVLTALLQERELLEARMAAGGTRDPMKRITGHSAMENAISSTKEMIAAMDRMLAQMGRRLPVQAGDSRRP
jgi:hypothetical protein